jgi:hypothetical protein
MSGRHPPVTTGRDATELLDVNGDQVADPVVLVADDFAQAAEPSPDEESVNGGRARVMSCSLSSSAASQRAYHLARQRRETWDLGAPA